MKALATFGLLAVLWLTAGATATLAAPPPPPPQQPPTADQTYVLGPADVIEVSVLGRTDFTTQGRIGEDGNIRLPYLGAVQAANRTSQQLSDDIAKALERGGYFSKPVVKVEVQTFTSRYVTVLGEVAKPGLTPTDRAYRLSEILARVGGVKETAADYVVLRRQTGPEQKMPIEELATGDLTQDPYVLPGDKIYSPKAEVFYVSGEVKTPGNFPIKADMTVRMAIARAGGVSAQGTEKKVQLTRKGAKLAHVDLNAKVEAGDIIVVGQRLF